MELINVRRLFAGLGALVAALLVWLLWRPTGVNTPTAARGPVSVRQAGFLPSPQPELWSRRSEQASLENLRKASDRVVIHIDRSLRVIDEVLEETNQFSREEEE